MAPLHMTEAELARDIAAALDRVQSGAEIIIERNAQPVAVLRATAPRRRKLSEIAASLAQDSTAVTDADFAADVQSFIDRHREPLDPPRVGIGARGRSSRFDRDHRRRARGRQPTKDHRRHNRAAIPGLEVRQQ